MSKEPNGTTPELIVLGRDEAGKPRAARFPAGHDNLVAKAAKAMNLTVCKADGDAVTDLAQKLQTGRLYATGRAFVPPVGRSLYGKLIEQLNLAGQPVGETDQTADQAAPGLPTTWDDIAVGHLVIAQEEGAKQGWWEAIVQARDGDMRTSSGAGWRRLQQRNRLGVPRDVRVTGPVAPFQRQSSQLGSYLCGPSFSPELFSDRGKP